MSHSIEMKANSLRYAVKSKYAFVFCNVALVWNNCAAPAIRHVVRLITEASVETASG